MVNNSTNRLISDTNPLVPRVIARGVVSYGSYTAFGSLYRATSSVILQDVLASSNPIVECYHYASNVFAQTLNRMNYSSSDSSGNMQFTALYYLTKVTSNGNDVIQINFEHIRTDQTERSAYYIVYSAGFSDEVVL